MWLIFVGIICHLVFFISVFDIYFRTPIVHGMPGHAHANEPLAKRLVLIVADGLRAESLYEINNGTRRAPFLRNIIETIGTWGVSHTRVPTESRPGHVAIIAGLYEDPSAIARGWRENPVEFDSIFNASRHTWSWGSPDILPMFALGSKHIETFTYDAGNEDFAIDDASKLDKWVFDKVSVFFSRAVNDPNLRAGLAQDRIIFFLHLLGLDTNGHANKPYSKEYINNIDIVDKGVKQITQLFREYFHDDKTAFVFTSDHGMTDWGSHGSGDISETQTPIIVWGAGIAGPQDPSNFARDKMIYDPRVEHWGLGHVRRHDVHQADIAPLMASVLGTRVPVNSVGILPTEYLDGSDNYKAEALYANAQQMLAQYQRKRAQREENTLPFFYVPFPGLLPDTEMKLVADIAQLIGVGDFAEAIDFSHQLIALSLQGMDYYHHYDRPILSVVIAFGFVSWIILVLCRIFTEHTSVQVIAANTIEGRRIQRQSVWLTPILVLYGVLTMSFLIVQKSPWLHYAYFLTPLVLWVLIYRRIESLRLAWLVVVSFDMVWEIALRCLFVVAGIEILVLSFFVRPMLSIGLMCLALWPFVMHVLQDRAESSTRLGWVGACVLLASFTYMPVVGREAVYGMVEFSGIVAFTLGLFGLYWCSGDEKPSMRILLLTAIHSVLLLTCVYLVRNSGINIQNHSGLPVLNQICAWLILAISLWLPMMCPLNVMGRLLSITGGLLCPFLLLSIRHEGFFFLALTVAMFLWLLLEFYLSGYNVQIATLRFAMFGKRELTGESDRYLEWSDIRRAYFFLFFIILAFFGTGNLASVNSFDPKFVYCFVTVFNPFVMGSLLLLKIILPFLLVTCFFHAICTLIQVPTRALFYIFLLLSDLMALHFFFLIRTEGSWLDIGTSLSHYVIAMATTVFAMALLFLAKGLTGLSLWPGVAEGLCTLPHLSSSRVHRD